MLLKVPEQTNVGLVRVAWLNFLERRHYPLESLVTVRPHLAGDVNWRIRPIVTLNEHEKVSPADPCGLRCHRHIFRVLRGDVSISFRERGPSGLHLCGPREWESRSV